MTTPSEAVRPSSLLKGLGPFRGVIAFGIAIGAVRFLLDLFTPGTAAAQIVGLYVGAPLVLIAFALRGLGRSLSWGKLLPTLFLVGFAIWFPVNTVAYTTGQLRGWNFGRYAFDREFHEKKIEAERINAERGNTQEPVTAEALLGRKSHSKTLIPPGETFLGKIRVGILTGIISSIVGAMWFTLWGAALIGLPNTLRARPLN